MPQTPLDTPLHDGRTLIEASAGSGKTRAITTLVARSVVEQERELDSILVVTFTKAATAELRKRIRKTLKAIQDGLTPGGTDDGQALELLEKWRAAESLSEERIRNRIDAALLDIDRANVYTIHGFCQRALNEFAFETGFPFGFDVRGDGAAIVEGVVRDLWQRRFRDCPRIVAGHASKRNFLPDPLAGWIDSLRSRTDLDIKGVPDPVIEPADAEPACRETLEHTRRIWREHGAGYCHILRESDALNRQSYRLPTVERKLADIEAVFAAAGLPADIDGLRDLTNWLGGERARGKCKKGRQLPENPLFDAFDDLSAACAALSSALDGWLLQTRKQIYDESGEKIRGLVRSERRLGYNDLLTETRRALESEAGPRLAAGIRGRFPVALIDEFQDTDPMQAQIFDRIYADPAESGGNSAFYMVGDPKQSIYEFRGADVFAYLSMQEGTDSSLQLGHNWRSAPDLVQAVNAIFDVPLAFTVPEIGFSRARPGRKQGAPLEIDGEGKPPFCIWLPDDQANNGNAGLIAVNETANEIIELLSLARDGRARIDGRPLRASDIAVLTPNRGQGREIARALRRLGGKCVEIDDSSVFTTREAEQLHRLLLALANPGRQDLRRSALVGDLFGLTSEQLLALGERDEAWNHWTGRFGDWRDSWLTRGVGAMLRKIVDAGGGAGNLLRYADGPRRLTNLYHLTELLQETETENRLSPAGVVAWLGRRLAGQTEGDDAARLRIESDEDLVRIMTIHGSKGLEFPIVYLPFVWYGRQIGKDSEAPISYHFRDGRRFPAVLDLAPDDWSREMRELEEFGESVRRLYVALTRARERCVVVWTRVEGRKNRELPPLAWLMHRNEQCDAALAGLSGAEYAAKSPAVPNAVADAYRNVRDDFHDKSREEFRADIQAVADRCPAGVEIRDLEVTTGPGLADESEIALERREFSRTTRRTRQMTSFSALSADHAAASPAHRHVETEAPDHDEREGGAAAQTDERETEGKPFEFNAFTFPRGINVGSCLHGIFETLDYEPEREIGEVCKQQLELAGIDPRWNDVARAMVENTRRAPLREPGQESFALIDISRRLTELEFSFPVNGVGRAALGELFERHGYPGLLSGGQDGEVIDGFLRGFIDLTIEHQGRWYVLDYKSNWLGGVAQDYERERLGAAMSEHRYRLQYLLYLLALHRYLQTRLRDYDYERHVGGAFYLFLRGMNPGAGMSRGVWFDRPSKECIGELDELMRGAGS